MNPLLIAFVLIAAQPPVITIPPCLGAWVRAHAHPDPSLTWRLDPVTRETEVYDYSDHQIMVLHPGDGSVLLECVKQEDA